MKYVENSFADIVVCASTLCLHSTPLPLGFPRLSPGYFTRTKSPAAQRWNEGWSRMGVLHWPCTARASMSVRALWKEHERCSWIKELHYWIHVAVVIARNLGECFPPSTEILEGNGLQRSLSIRNETPIFLQAGIWHLSFIPSSNSSPTSSEMGKLCIYSIDYMGYGASFVMPESSRNPSLLITMWFSATPMVLYSSLPLLLPWWLFQPWSIRAMSIC